MARQATGISTGIVLDTLIKRLESKNINGINKPNKRGRRKYLPIKTAEEAIKECGSLYTVIYAAQPEYRLSDREDSFLTSLHNLSDSDLSSLCSIIKQCQNNWWQGYMSNPAQTSIPDRLRDIASRRVGTYRSLDPQTFPIFTSFDPIRTVDLIPTDKLAGLCNELDVPYPAFCVFEQGTPYYSQRWSVDTAFCNYKFLDPSLRVIPEIYCSLLLNARKEGGLSNE